MKISRHIVPRPPASPSKHNIVKGQTEIRVGRDYLGHLNLYVDLLVVCLPLAFQMHHLRNSDQK